MPAPPATRPGDFERFWSDTLRELDAVEPALAIDGVDDASNPDLQMAELAFASLGQVRIGGYAVSWRDRKPRPLVIHAHGYGSVCEPRWQWAAAGLNVVGVDVRGYGRSRDALPARSRYGWVLTGCETPETHVLRGAICDYVQAVRVARTLHEPAPTRVVTEGTSFAGGLALMAEAVSPSADLLVVGVPTFGWAEGRQFLTKAGSGAEINHFLEDRPERAEDLAVVLRYFDSMNFAGLVRCPALVGVGRRDDVVPAATVYAIARHLTGRHEVLEFPVSHSDSPEEQQWERFERYWIDLALRGVPAGFGGR